MATYRVTEGSLAEGFMNSRAKVQFYAGGFANGKTAALCIKFLNLAKDYPGANILLARATYPKLNDTLRKEFFKWCPPSWIKRRPTKDDNTLVLTNGTHINFRYIQQQGRLSNESTTSNLLSATYDAVGVDQMEDPEIVEKDFFDLLGRLRGMASYSGDDPTMPLTGPRFFCLTCNPTRNWVYRRLVRPLHRHFAGVSDPDLLVDTKTQKPIIELYEGSTYENADNLELDFIETLESTYKGQMRSRFLMGEWAAYEGLVYPQFDEVSHGISQEALERYYWQLRSQGYLPTILEGFDFGVRVPSCYLLGFADHLGNIFILDGYYEPEKPVEWLGQEIKVIRNRYQIMADEAIKADPAIFRRTGGEHKTIGRSVSQLFLEEEGLMMSRGNNDILNGILKIQTHLHIQKFHKHPITGMTGAPCLFVNERLEFVINEFGEYYWKTDTTGEQLDKPVDKSDHAMDTIKYMLSDVPAIALATRYKPDDPPPYMFWREVEEESKESNKSARYRTQYDG